MISFERNGLGRIPLQCIYLLVYAVLAARYLHVSTTNTFSLILRRRCARKVSWRFEEQSGAFCCARSLYGFAPFCFACSSLGVFSTLMRLAMLASHLALRKRIAEFASKPPKFAGLGWCDFASSASALTAAASRLFLSLFFRLRIFRLDASFRTLELPASSVRVSGESSFSFGVRSPSSFSISKNIRRNSSRGRFYRIKG